MMNCHGMQIQVCVSAGKDYNDSLGSFQSEPTCTGLLVVHLWGVF